jgi:ABC-type sulfate transport system permease component
MSRPFLCNYFGMLHRFPGFGIAKKIFQNLHAFMPDMVHGIQLELLFEHQQRMCNVIGEMRQWVG